MIPPDVSNTARGAIPAEPKQTRRVNKDSRHDVRRRNGLFIEYSADIRRTNGAGLPNIAYDSAAPAFTGSPGSKERYRVSQAPKKRGGRTSKPAAPGMKS
jgi:hypothetical protein